MVSGLQKERYLKESHDMSEIETRRAYQERLLGGFERSRLRAEVQRSKRSHIERLKRRYATMVLGASLAVGGFAIPMKVTKTEKSRTDLAQSAGSSRVFDALADDVKAANMIARQVTGGVEQAARTVTRPVQQTVDIAETAAGSMQSLREAARAEFFKKEVPFGELIYKEAKKNNLPPELVAAVVQQESRFVPTAKSPAGARGLMQLMPRTGQWMGAKNLMNPAENVKAGTKYLKYLHERFDGNERMVIAAYNAGEGNVKRFGGTPPFRETQKYLRNVQSFKQEYNERLAGKIAETLENRIASADGPTGISQ